MSSARQACSLATEIRDCLYGAKTRPLPNILRWEWAGVCTQHRRSGSLLAADVYRVAAALAEELRPRWPIPASPENDLALRLELASRLRAEAKRLNRPRLTSAQRREGRIRTLAKG